MGAKVQWLTETIGILRVGPEFKDHEDRDDYTFACTIVRNGSSAKCLGAFSDINAAIASNRAALKAELLANNITKVSWERCNRNRCKRVEKIVQ